MRKKPLWFNYAIDYFLAVDLDHANSILVEKGIDAMEVISIEHNEHHGFRVYYRSLVDHSKE